MRAALILVAVVALPAMGQEPKELAPGVHMAPIQEGTVTLLGANGLPEDAPTRVAAGYYITLVGEERLAVSIADLQAEARSQQARAASCQQTAALIQPPPSGGGYGRALLIVGGAFALGMGVGIYVARK